MSNLSNQQLGAYQLQDPIGRGGIATVYKAYHPPTERHVAVKVLSWETASDSSFNERFDREAKVVANLQHIHILPVFDYGNQNGTAYLVMPLITGGTLSEKLRKKRPSNEEVVRLFGQLASALDYAHQKGLLHRDIKPSNVLIDSSGNTLLADFGLTRMIGGEHTSKLTQSTVIGTPAYMSPEQGQGLTLDARSDLYAMGVLLFEMLAGDVPYKADTPVAVIFKHLTDPLPSIAALRPDLPPAVDALLKKALAKTAPERFGTAGEMAAALEKALSGGGKAAATILETQEPQTMIAAFNAPTAHRNATLPTQEHDEATLRLPSQARISQHWLWALAALLVGIVGIGAFVALSGGDSTPEEAPPNDLVWQIEAHPEGALAVAFSSDGSRLLSGGADNLAQVWEAQTGASLFKLESHSADVRTVAISPDGKTLITGGDDSMSYTWDAATGAAGQTNIAGLPVRGVAYSSEGAYWAYIAGHTLSITDTTVGYSTKTLFHPSEAIFQALAFSLDETKLATGDENGDVIVWDTAAQTVVETFVGDASPVTSLVYTPYGLLVAYANGMFRLWAGDESDYFASQESPIQSLAYRLNGQLLAAGLEDGTIIIWKVPDLTEIKRLTGHQGAVKSVAFSPHGQQVVSAGADGTLRLWQVE